MIWPLLPLVRTGAAAESLWRIPLELLDHGGDRPEPTPAAVTVHLVRDTTGLWAAYCPETGGDVCGCATPWAAMRRAVEG